MEDSASTAAGPHATGRGRWLVPVAASALAVVQNYFETKAPQANIDVCDGRDYFMQCRVIAIPLAE